VGDGQKQGAIDMADADLALLALSIKAACNITLLQTETGE
jgi:hypothetical protein